VKIEASSLTTCAVVKGGDSISLGLIDESGRTIELTVSALDACALSMTLPNLLKKSLKEKYQDPSLRYVFPLDGWHVEAASDGSQVIMTLTTGGGFEVSFATTIERCRSLGSALHEGADYRMPDKMALAN
jgi:hypothetical protein